LSNCGEGCAKNAVSREGEYAGHQRLGVRIDIPQPAKSSKLASRRIQEVELAQMTKRAPAASLRGATEHIAIYYRLAVMVLWGIRWNGSK
jgi:hypothetical protein